MEVNPIVVMETSEGVIEFELYPNEAPKACENFLTHGKKGYYNEVIFHRIIPGFMIQGGDPLGRGTGGESIWKAPFEDECVKTLRFNVAGILAMANAGPNSNGSQFFITTAHTPWLNDKHTIFGRVVSGMSVIKKIESLGSSSGRPSKEVKILKVFQKSKSIKH